LQEYFLNRFKQGLRSRRIDWLLHVLLGPVTSFYLHKVVAAEQGLGYNKSMENLVTKSAFQASKIGDSQLTLPERQGEAVIVQSSTTAAVYMVTCPGTPEAGCDCTYFLRGNLCKHIMKV
jgi:hypothetical protein